MQVRQKDLLASAFDFEGSSESLEAAREAAAASAHPMRLVSSLASCLGMVVVRSREGGAGWRAQVLPCIRAGGQRHGVVLAWGHEAHSCPWG